MTDDNKKQLEEELSERLCPECHKVSYYGDWIWRYRFDGTSGHNEMECPKCGAVCDAE